MAKVVITIEDDGGSGEIIVSVKSKPNIPINDDDMTVAQKVMMMFINKLAASGPTEILEIK